MGYETIRKAEKCNECGQVTKPSVEKLCCDNCHKVIEDDTHLRSAVFFTYKPTEHYYYCSWQCFFESLEAIERACDYFIELPYLHYDVPGDSAIHANRFFEFLKTTKKVSK